MELINIISVIALVGVVLITIFYQLNIIIWTSLIGVTLLLVTVFSHLSAWFLIPVWIIFLIAAAFANLTKLRQKYIISPAMAKLQKQMPSISNTEKDAIESGDIWWEKELFCGKPEWKKLLEIPKPTLTTEEINFLNNQVAHVCSILNDWEIVHKNHDLPEDLWKYLIKEKFFAMVIPKEYGGLGFSALAHSTVVTKLASRSISVAVTTMVPNSLGPGELLVHYGTDAQKKYYLPRLASGEDIPCFALTAPDAGSDAGAIPDNGIVTKGMHEGKEVVGIKLSWDKRYITLAPVSTLLGLAIHLYDPEHLLGNIEDIGITLCLIPTSHPGVEVGNRHLPMYQAFMNGPTRGKDVFIPLDWIIGGEKMAGKGWRMLMESLSIGRSISLPALSTACGKLAYRITGAYSKIRRQFNTPIAAFEGVEEALGYIAGYTYMLEACRLMTAGAVDLNINPAIVSAIAKYHMTEMARYAVSHGMDIHAGQMIQAGPRNPLSNIYLSVPISITVEGANILTRNLIIFGQGAIRCHPFLLKEIGLLTASTPDVAELDRTLLSHIGFYINNFVRSFIYGLTGGFFISSPVKRLRKHTRHLTRMSTALALFADTSLILLGGSLKRRERISARLGDVMSQLYLASTALKFFHDNGMPKEEECYVNWAVQHSLYKAQIALNELFNNFPNRFVGQLLRFIIFPFGNSYSQPKDSLHKKIVAPMLVPSELRDRLTQYSYRSKNPEELEHRLETALLHIIEIEPILKKIHKATASKILSKQADIVERINAAVQANVISADEAKQLKKFEKLRNEIIKVDEFSFDLSEVIA